MKNYLELLNDIVISGFDHEDRTGVGRRSVFARELRFDMKDGFPLVTTRQVFSRGMIAETLWFLTGSMKSTELSEQGVKIWDQWTPTKEDADAFFEKYIDNKHEKSLEVYQILGSMSNVSREFTPEEIYARVGTIGKMYGAQWADFGGYNQIDRLITGLKNQPFHSRHVVNAWNDEYLPVTGFTPKENVLMGKGALAPCHYNFQCFVSPSKTSDKLQLSLKVAIR